MLPDRNGVALQTGRAPFLNGPAPEIRPGIFFGIRKRIPEPSRTPFSHCLVGIILIADERKMPGISTDADEWLAPYKSGERQAALKTHFQSARTFLKPEIIPCHSRILGVLGAESLKNVTGGLQRISAPL